MSAMKQSPKLSKCTNNANLQKPTGLTIDMRVTSEDLYLMHTAAGEERINFDEGSPARRKRSHSIKKRGSHEDLEILAHTTTPARSTERRLSLTSATAFAVEAYEAAAEEAALSEANCSVSSLDSDDYDTIKNGTFDFFDDFWGETREKKGGDEMDIEDLRLPTLGVAPRTSDRSKLTDDHWFSKQGDGISVGQLGLVSSMMHNLPAPSEKFTEEDLPKYASPRLTSEKQNQESLLHESPVCVTLRSNMPELNTYTNAMC